MIKKLIIAAFFIAALFAFFPSGAEAAITFDASSTVSGADSTASSTVATTSLTISSSLTNRIVILTVSTGLGSPSSSAMTATYAGQAMTLAATADDNTNNATVRIFYLVDPPTGTNTASSSWTNQQGYVMGVSSFGGVDQTTPVEATSTAFNTGSATTTVQLNITTVTSSAWVVDAFSVGAAASTVGTGQVLIWKDILSGSFDPGAGSSYATTTNPGSVNMRWTLSGTRQWSHAAVALRPASASPPGTPGTPTYSGQASSTPGTLTVEWTASSGSPDYYKIENSSDGNTFAQVATTSATSYATTTLSANTTYWYRVRGNNAGGDGSYSASSSVLTYPDTPGTPTYTGVASTSVTVNWSDPTGSASSTKIERASSANGTYSQIATTTALSYTNTGLTSSTTYWYRVRATNATGDGLYSATSSVTTASAGSTCGGGSGNISTSTTAHWAWNDSIGWIDFCSNGTVNVSSTGISGYASSSAGEVSLDCATSPSGNICGSSNYQVLNDGSGNLTGWAWNDLYGWISFCGGSGSANCPGSTSYQVTIDSNGDFSGFAWNDVAGWVSFNCNQTTGNTCGSSNYKVMTSWTGAAVATSTTGILDSATYDTGIANGAQLNSIFWRGYQPAGTSVYFQIAVSNDSNGPWNFMGTDGTANTYYSATAGTPIPLDYSLFSGFRYFRYRVTLVGNSDDWSPRVDEVIVNWSP